MKKLLVLIALVAVLLILVWFKTENAKTLGTDDSKELYIEEKKVSSEHITIPEEHVTSADSEMPICDATKPRCLITYYSWLYEIDYKVALSIAMWETGNFVSDAYKYNNNVGGMMYWDGSRMRLMKFGTLKEGVIAYIENLKYRYFDRGLDTLEKIQPIYCPVGVNDNGTNQYWLNGTKRIYDSL